MARRNSSGPKWFDLPGYSDVYARTVTPWQTRRGRRNREFATFASLLGLNTAFDDLHKKDGESPYLRNVRYMGEKQTTQRAQATSRYGQRFLYSIGDEKTYPEKADAQTYLELYEGKSIEFDVGYNDLLIGGMMFIHNTENAKGVLRIMLKRDEASEPICDAVIDLEKTDKLGYRKQEFRFIQGLEAQSKALGGSATLRLEILDDVEPQQCQNATPVLGRKIRILASGRSGHRSALYQLPNTDNCMREQEYVFNEEPGIPLFGTLTNGYKTLPGGIKVCCGDKHHIVYPVVTPQGSIEIYRQQLPSGRQNSDKCACGTQAQHTGRCSKPSYPGDKPYKIDAPVHRDACAVRMIQAGEHIYYVDGHSDLQRIKICDWTSEKAVPTADEIDTTLETDPADLTAKPGASLILMMRNRVYLSGFKDDPNFVQFSLIDGEGAKYDQFNEGFYSPDRSPEASACGPITALAQMENSLVIFRTDGSSVFSAPTGLEFGKAQQQDTFAWNIGVPNQEAVASGNGQIYFWNRSEGFRRFAGTDSKFQSLAIDNELRNIADSNNVFMLAHGNKVRFWFDRNNVGHADHALVYHTILAGSSPWYMDNNVPVRWAIGDQNSDTIYAMHSQYPATFIVDQPDQMTDFDSSIKFEYSTAYVAPGEMMGHTIVRRVQAKVMANSTNSWFIGVDFDHKDNPAVWRKFVRGQVDQTDNEDAVFGNTAEAGSDVINLFMRAKCHDFQIRVLVYCYRSQAELVALVGEYQGVRTL